MMSMTERAVMDAYNDGEDHGIVLARAEDIATLVRNLGITVNEAFDALSIPTEKRELFREEVGKILLPEDHQPE